MPIAMIPARVAPATSHGGLSVGPAVAAASVGGMVGGVGMYHQRHVVGMGDLGQAVHAPQRYPGDRIADSHGLTKRAEQHRRHDLPLANLEGVSGRGTVFHWHTNPEHEVTTTSRRPVVRRVLGVGGISATHP